MAYSDKVLDHYTNPRNVGSLDKSSPEVGTGLVGAPECGDVMKLQIKVNPETNIIVYPDSEGHTPTPEIVERIHRAKTGALITSSIVCGGLLGLGQTEGLAIFNRTPARVPPPTPSPSKGMGFSPSIKTPNDAGALAPEAHPADKAGLAFQIIDDILDVTQTSAELGKTAGKDTAAIKATWPAVYGLEQSRRDAVALIADAFAALAPFGPAATPLKSLAQYLVDRTH